MNVWKLVLREITHRKGNFTLGLLSIAVAVGCLVGALTLLDGDAVRTRQILTSLKREQQQAIADREAEVRRAGVRLKDAYRKITKGLGFNILILPRDQDPDELHLEGSLSKTMPESYAEKLANSKIVTVNHLLPMVMKKLDWKEQKQKIVLIGTRGEVPLMHRALKKPLQAAVPAGTLVLGFSAAQHGKLKAGDSVTLLGKTFTINKVHPRRGSLDDVTVWMNLKEAQQLLGMQNLVNAILALECNCAATDRLADVRGEIAAILPGTQISERGGIALARAEARNRAATAAKESLQREKQAASAALTREEQGRATIRRQRESFAGILVPVVMIGCVVSIGFLAFSNVRQRSAEIGILRAIGFRSRQILVIFLGKALLVGLAGAAVGYLAGLLVGARWSGLSSTGELFQPSLLTATLILAPLLACLASWIPAMLAARQDPAVVLQDG